MRWRSVSLTACSAVLLAGCGGGAHERLPVPTALRLQQLAAHHDCRGLIRAAVLAVNRHEIPGPLQEQVLGDANACRFASSFRP